MTMHDDQADVTTETVATLIQEQFPRWSGKAIRLLPSTGTVNAIFRIGNDLSARFPLRLADAPRGCVHGDGVRVRPDPGVCSGVGMMPA
ncbi:hypothetical protein ADL12_06490 [Streptomyces regalis]|uniref:Aminoglycoside phosphotransferase domain-containing protein n=1 Tax=Streptomyces regalis TaxID=68262 RepID=A0A0X3VGP0_9ACTN|nr:hypothetical protein ADL12_06490 [Streptomyces regalis]